MVLASHSVVTPSSQIRLPAPPLCSCTYRSWSGLTFTTMIIVIVWRFTAAWGVKLVCVVIGRCCAVVHGAVLNCLWSFQENLRNFFFILYYDQQKHNYFTNYHTSTCFRFLWPCIVSKAWRERKPTRCNNQMFIINFSLNMFRASLCPSSGEQRPCVTEYHGLCCPEDGHNDARNMLRQNLIINIWLLHLVGFLSLHTLLHVSTLSCHPQGTCG